MIINNKNFETEINGLRGVAIILVILFHYQIYPFSGGFIGVDIFFVISGYLIGKIINKKSLNFKNYKEFISNRIRRIFPGLLGLLIFTFIFSILLLSPSHFKDLAKSFLFNLLLVPNFFFWSESNYFDVSSYYKPLLHTWSLGVEYHFYLLWPIFIWLIFHLTRKTLIKNIIFISFIIISILITDYLNNFSPVFEHKLLHGVYVRDTIFFLTPFRLFEFTLGYLLTINQYRIKNNFFNELIFLIGFLVLIFCSINFNENTFFPGSKAFFPTFSAFLLIFSKRANFFGFILRNKLINFFGNISYSLYLYHWPILIFYKYFKFKELNFTEKLLCMSLSIFIAYLSYIFIEKNYLKLKKFKFDKKLLYLTFFFIILSFSVISSNGWDFRLKKFEKNIYSNNDNNYGGICGKFNNLKKNEDCLFGNKDKINFLLIGDSHGKALYNGFLDFSKKNNFNFLTYEDMCETYPNYSSNIINCKIEIEPPQIIVIGKKFYDYQFQDKDLNVIAKKYLDKILEIKQNQIFKNVKKIIIFGQVPEFYSSSGDLISCYTRPFFINKQNCDEYFNNDIFEETNDIFKSNQGLDKKRILNNFLKINIKNKSSENLKIYFFDPFEKFCNSNKCIQVKDGKMIYYDSTHLSIFGSKYLIEKFEKDLLEIMR